MIAFPNAKINLGLYVERRREDGYHDISTVFYPIPLTDIVEVVPAGKTVLKSYGNPVNCEPEKNLVMKAYRMLEREFSLPPVEICLYKRIPDGAGLGGGSSDASSVLKIVNELFDLHLSNESLAERAAIIGADCPFFIYNRPMAARGIGDLFSEVQVDLSGLTLVIVKPDVSVPTALAYSHVVPRLPERQIEQVLSMPIEGWKAFLENKFEESVFTVYPELGGLKQKMYEAGAVYASMSGSGSAMYALFRNDNMAESFLSTLDGMCVFKFSL